MTYIYKIISDDIWRDLQVSGVFHGAGVDLIDGFIHFSCAHQVKETAAKHFAGISNLVLLRVETLNLGKALKWEPSRGGDLFPHLYAPLSLNHVINAAPLPFKGEQGHDFTGLVL